METNPNDRVTDPADPPQSLLRPPARRAVLLSYLGPVVALFAVVGIALIYWVNRGPVSSPHVENRPVGTSGQQLPGGNPHRPFDTTRDELEYRGTDQASNTVTTIAGALAGDPATPQRVTLADVIVDRAEAEQMWVGADGERIAVMTPRGVTLQAGARVRVSGMTESDGRGAIRIRAASVTPVR